MESGTRRGRPAAPRALKLILDKAVQFYQERKRTCAFPLCTAIQKLVLRLAEKGTSATFISSEIDEMLRTCSRLIVMRDRKAVGELSGADLTQTKIMATIAGGDES